MNRYFAGERLPRPSVPLLHGARSAHAQSIDSPVPTVSSSGFAAASIHLYSRLWWALDQAVAEPDTRDGAVETQVVMLRLELVVLLDACEGARWRSLLRREEQVDLRSTLESVLECLAADMPAREVVALAQNRLLDAVLERAALATLSGSGKAGWAA